MVMSSSTDSITSHAAPSRNPRSSFFARHSMIRPLLSPRILLLAVALVCGFYLVSPAPPVSAVATSLPAPIVTAIPGDGSVTLSWEQPVPGRQAFGAIVWREVPNNWSGSVTFDLPADGSKTSHTITGLTNGKTYEFRFHFIDRPASEYLDALVYTQVTVGVPQAPVVSVAALSSQIGLDVTWDEPQNNGESITSYDVQYKGSADETWEDDNVTFPDGQVRSAKITDLVAGVQYDVRVRAKNSRGAGPWSAVATGTPLAQQISPDPVALTGLGITGTVERGGETYTFRLLSNPWFDSDTATYTVRVPSDLKTITFTPYWTSTAITAVVLKERANSNSSTLNSSEAARTTSSDTSLTSGANPRFPAIEVLTSGDPQVYYFNFQRTSLSFGGATVDDMTFTEGGEISFLGLSEYEKDALRLPIATGGFYNVTYTTTGLPEGLWMGGDGRVIHGTPESATTSPATVTYTATDDIGGSASLTFDVTVAPPVEFDEDERQAFKDTIFVYTVGQTERIEATLPKATGGHGDLTYHLTYRVKEQRIVDGRQITGGVRKTIDDDAPGFSFDSATRVLTSDTGGSAPSAEAFYSVNYWAEDANGARASASNSISVREAPTLPEIADRSFTVGENVSVTLPKAVGGAIVGIGIRYRLEPAVKGLFFNGRQHVRSISGKPYVPGTTEVTYTATDRNNVSATRSFTITVVNGSSVPTSAPASLNAGQVYSGADPNGSGVWATWGPVSGATDYVVQVIVDGGSYPTTAVNSVPDGVNLSLPAGDYGLAWINAISSGDYKIRVAARNEAGVGPWSLEATFTVTGPTQQPLLQQQQQQQQQVVGQGDPCDNCGTENELGVAPDPGQTQAQQSDLIAQMYEWREDPEWSSFKEHTDRWDRALLAFGETVEDATLTPMTAAEAQGFADRGDAWSRWVEVAAALREMEASKQQQSPQQQDPPNQASTASVALEDVSDLEAGDTHEVSLSDVFSVTEGVTLTITASSDDEDVATVTVSSDGSTLTVTGVSAGEATITVVAEYSDGNRVTAEFDVTVTAPATQQQNVQPDPQDDVKQDTSTSTSTSVPDTDSEQQEPETSEQVDQDTSVDQQPSDEPSDVPVSETPDPEPTQTPEPTPEPEEQETETETSDMASRYDADGDGKISQTELKRALEDYYSANITESEFLKIHKAYQAS